MHGLDTFDDFEVIMMMIIFIFRESMICKLYHSSIISSLHLLREVIKS